MTSYAVQRSLGPVAPLVSKDKGSVGNRMNCAGAQAKNEISKGVQSAGVIAGGIGANALLNNLSIVKKGRWNTVINNYLKKVVSDWKYLTNDPICGSIRNTFGGKLGFSAFVKNHGVHGKFAKIRNVFKYAMGKVTLNMGDGLSNIMKKLSKTSGKQKVLAMVTLLTLGVLNYVQGKHDYKSGQIDQKYTDRAKMEKNLV